MKTILNFAKTIVTVDSAPYLFILTKNTVLYLNIPELRKYMVFREEKDSESDKLMRLKTGSNICKTCEYEYCIILLMAIMTPVMQCTLHRYAALCYACYCLQAS